MSENIYVDVAGVLQLKTPNTREAGKLYRDIGVEPNGSTGKLLELTPTAQQRVEDAWAADDVERAKPPPPDPNDELDTAIDEALVDIRAATTVLGLRAAVVKLVKGLKGQTGKKGRIAGRPV